MVWYFATTVGPSLAGINGPRIPVDGALGNAKAPIASNVDAPSAPTTNARREIAGVLAVEGSFAGCGGTVGAFAGGEGVVLGGGVGFFSSDMSSVALKEYFLSSSPNRIKDLSIRYDLFGRAVISETI